MESANVFAHDWGAPLRLVLAVASVFLWAGSFYWVVRRLVAPAGLSEGWPSRLAMLILVLGGLCFFAGILAFSPWPSPYRGRYVALYLLRSGERERYVVQTRLETGKGGVENSYLLMGDCQRPDSSVVELPARDVTETRARLAAARGRLMCWETAAGYVSVDVEAGRVVARESERGQSFGAYRRQGFDEQRWGVRVLRANGETGFIALSPRPEEDDAPQLIAPDRGQCSTWTAHPNPSARAHQLLRVRPVRGSGSCAFGPTRLELYLHRTTVFGEGDHVLSALDSRDEVAWSLNLSQRFGPLDRYDVLLAEPHGDVLRLWIGAGETVFLVDVEPDSGRTLLPRALY